MGEVRHRVLIADDYEADRFFLKEAIRRHAPLLEVVAEVQDGTEVVSYLQGAGEYGDRDRFPFPELLIMDLRMPRMTGLEVLEWLKTQNFSGLKVAMLADSSFVKLKERAANLGLQHFYSKVINTSELVEVVRKLQAELEDGSSGRAD